MQAAMDEMKACLIRVPGGKSRSRRPGVSTAGRPRPVQRPPAESRLDDMGRTSEARGAKLSVL